MSRGGLLKFFGVAGAGFVVVGLAAVTSGSMGGAIAGATFLFIGVIWIVVAVAVGGWYKGIANKRADAERLFTTGRRATAVIERVEQTSSYSNNMPSFNVVVRVEPKFGTPFTHETRLVTIGNGVPIPGHLVEVAYDPNDTSTVAFETHKGMAIPPGEVWVMRPPERATEAAAAAAAHGADDREADDRLDALERLAKLRESGVLTDAEFEAEKARLLNS